MLEPVPQPKKVMLWFESILGRGHMPIADRMATALMEQGHDVHVVSTSFWRGGGATYGGAQLHDYSDSGKFRILYDEEKGGYVTPSGVRLENAQAWHDLRYASLVETVQAIQPDAILIDHYPFGRGNVQDIHRLVTEYFGRRPKEQRPIIVGEARDVILSFDPMTGGSEQAVADIVRDYFDKIFIVGDGKIKLGDYFSAAHHFEDKIHYAGYVGKPMPKRNPEMLESDRPVIISGGGSPTSHGLQLAETAIAAKRFV